MKSVAFALALAALGGLVDAHTSPTRLLAVAGAVALPRAADAHSAHNRFRSAVVLNGLDVNRFNVDGFAKIDFMQLLIKVFEGRQLYQFPKRALETREVFDERGEVVGGKVLYQIDSWQKTSALKRKLIESLESGEFQQLVDAEKSSVVSKTTVDVNATIAIVLNPRETGGHDNSPKEDEGLSGLAIAAIVVGCLAFLVLLAVFVVDRRRRARRREFYGFPRPERDDEFGSPSLEMEAHFEGRYLDDPGARWSSESHESYGPARKGILGDFQ